MVFSYFILALTALSLSHCTYATQRSSPPTGSITVGSSGTYKTISAAVAAAKKGDSIFIYAGTYKEAVSITVDNLKIYGQTDEYATFILGSIRVILTFQPNVTPAHYPTVPTKSLLPITALRQPRGTTMLLERSVYTRTHSQCITST
jgi:pectin methylesterase-like acyl-CoA thioesterase